MIDTLPGFREFYPESCYARNAVFQSWRETAASFGFQEFDAPILEPLELFTQKSGEEIVEQLFSFEDKGGRKVALRPETTPSLARLVGAKASSLKMPVKWFNITENFRYERPQKGRLRSFYQFNVDIIGEKSFRADAELISLAIESFKKFGLTREHFFVRLSDRQLWKLWLNGFEIIDESSVLKILSILDKWEKMPEAEIKENITKALLSKNCNAEDFFEKTNLLKNASSLNEILSLFSNFSQDIKTQTSAHLEQWQNLLNELENLNCIEFVKIDLGVVRGLAYYTGFVFEVFEEGKQGRALAGGGRYDDLMEKLTGHSLPATGFAAGDVTLGEILQKYNLQQNQQQINSCFLAFDEKFRKLALSDATKLRNNGFATSYAINDAKSVQKQLKKVANTTRFIVFYEENEVSNNQIRIKDLTSNNQIVVPHETLLHELNNLL